MLKTWLEDVRKSACGSIETLEATYDICCMAMRREIAGDFVEAGVYSGAHPAVMARAILDVGAAGRRVHLFDTFTGIPAFGEHDDEFRQSGVPANHSACSLEQVRQNLEDWGLPAWMFVYHKGLFCDTVAPTIFKLDKIAYLRLDGDLYESTRDCLPLLDRVSNGGWICIDDFNLSGCRKAVMERIVPAPLYWRTPTK